MVRAAITIRNGRIRERTGQATETETGDGAQMGTDITIRHGTTEDRLCRSDLQDLYNLPIHQQIIFTFTE